MSWIDDFQVPTKTWRHVSEQLRAVLDLIQPVLTLQSRILDNGIQVTHDSLMSLGCRHLTIAGSEGCEVLKFVTPRTGQNMHTSVNLSKLALVAYARSFGWTNWNWVVLVEGSVATEQPHPDSNRFQWAEKQMWNRRPHVLGTEYSGIHVLFLHQSLVCFLNYLSAAHQTDADSRFYNLELSSWHVYHRWPTSFSKFSQLKPSASLASSTALLHICHISRQRDGWGRSPRSQRSHRGPGGKA